MNSKINHHYVSEIDTFLKEFDKNRTTSLPISRIQEIEKHKKIALKRDNVIKEEKSSIWEGFD